MEIGHEEHVDRSLSAGLAMFSIALGTVELIAPRLLSRVIGLEPRPSTMRMLGLREIATGIGMLTRPSAPTGPAARVAGDAVDLAVVAFSPSLRPGTRLRRIAALAALAGVAAIDLYAARRLAA